MSIELIRSRAARIRATNSNQIVTLYGVKVAELEGDDLRDALCVISDLYEQDRAGLGRASLIGRL